jgi:hypothetical protein
VAKEEPWKVAKIESDFAATKRQECTPKTNDENFEKLMALT